MDYPKGVDGPLIVNGMVAYAIDRATEGVISDVDALVTNRLAALEREIYTARANYDADKEMQIARLSEADILKRAQLKDELQALRTQLRQRRENRIDQLEEAISIASALGIKADHPIQHGQEIRSSGNVVRTEVTNQAAPLYYGYRSTGGRAQSTAKPRVG